MEFLLSDLGPSFAFYAGAAGLLTAVGLARRAPAGAAYTGPGLGAIWGPLGLAALAAAFAAAAPADIRLAAGGLLLTGLTFVALAPARTEWTPPGRRLGHILIVVAIAVALAGAFLSSPDAPNSAL
jgi:hypothetical protein